MLKHSIIRLVEEGYVDADGVACAAARATQNLLRLHRSFCGKQSSSQKLERGKEKYNSNY
jgi:hypothetical protein